MTRYAWISVWFAGVLSGCLPTDFVTPPEPKNLGAKPMDPAAQIARPPVTAAQIDARNAQEKAQILRQELDRDLEQAIEANDAKPDKK
jgi:hypothetical protein